MQCPFLLQAGEACYCEVLADHWEDWLRLRSSWVCRNAWAELCLHFEDVMKQADHPSQPLIDDRETIHPSRFGHINRIGGLHSILSDLT